MSIAGIGEFVVVGRKLLQALHGNLAEVPRERRIFGQDRCAPCNEAVNQRLIRHRDGTDPNFAKLTALIHTAKLHFCPRPREATATIPARKHNKKT